ncbi:Stage 0 sporulation protein J [bioreactor metagenome]|uniref:Stage 0 sporulation protein J n=1 Tax=bioreactor metagenome TaxID=1076179 RepID=A0A644UMU3_9ZZZZ|nr:ParB/RepB/Spo0J family partition protein [Acidaminococcaceae bacterium]
MAIKTSGLGKSGLDSVFGGKKEIVQAFAKGEATGDIAINDLIPNPYQPRKTFEPAKLKELINSIKESGVIQPLIVRKAGEKYEIVAGERRWRAAKEVGLDFVPAVVRKYDDATMMEVALIENMQRSDLNPMEEAEGLRNMMEKLGITQAEVAKKMGMSKTAVSNALRLLNLPDSIRKFVEKGDMTMGQVRPLFGVGDENRMEELAMQIVTNDWSARTVEDVVNEYKEGNTVKVVREKITSLGLDGKKKKNNVKKTTKKEQDIYAKDFQNDLTEYLGTRVKVVKGRGDAGKIIIEYYSYDDLERIYELLQKSKISKKDILTRGNNFNI